MNSAFIKTNNSSPLCDMMSLPVMREVNVVAFIFSLIKQIRPIAIIRAVSLVVISPFKGEVFWTRAHVNDEVIKRFKPSSTNTNPPSAVIFEFTAIRINASRLHCHVNAVFFDICRAKFIHFAFLCKQSLMKWCVSPVRVQGFRSNPRHITRIA